MKHFEYSKEIAQAVKAFVDSKEWRCHFDEQRGIFDFGLKLGCKLQKVRLILDVKEDALVAYGICPVSAERGNAEMMAQMAEFICRANYGLLNGNFELDFRDGEIRYKSYVDCEELIPSADVIDNCIHCICAMFTRYSSGILDIIFADGTAKAAIAACEKSPEQELRSMLAELSPEEMAELTEHFGFDPEALLSRLAEDNEEAPAEEAPAEHAPKIRTDLFSRKKKGGAA